MRSISTLQSIINEELSNINFPSDPSNLYDPISYVLGLGGKRIRSILALLAHQLFNTEIKTGISSALALEVFHNFTLLHDDIMDKAPLRRGSPTVHTRWDNNVAILSGDTMLVYAYKLFLETNETITRDVLSAFNKAAIEVCEGQQLDVDYGNRSDITISDYLRMIEYKTAVLIAVSLKIGAITGGGSLKEQDSLYDFGINLGIGFQLKDDLLDVFGDPKKFGKRVGGDIIENKKTFLYLKALQLSDKNQQDKLKTYFSSSDHIHNKVNLVKSIFIDLDIHNITLALIKDYHKNAIRNLDAINVKDKDLLLSFADSLLERVT